MKKIIVMILIVGAIGGTLNAALRCKVGTYGIPIDKDVWEDDNMQEAEIACDGKDKIEHFAETRAQRNMRRQEQMYKIAAREASEKNLAMAEAEKLRKAKAIKIKRQETIGRHRQQLTGESIQAPEKGLAVNPVSPRSILVARTKPVQGESTTASSEKQLQEKAARKVQFNF